LRRKRAVAFRGASHVQDFLPMSKRDILKFLSGVAAAFTFVHVAYAVATARGTISVPIWRGREWGIGKMLIEAIATDTGAKLAGALDVSGAPSIGTDAASFLGQPSGVMIEADLARGLADADYLIDFTRPEGTLRHLAYCAEHGIKMIIGTTGFDDAGKAAIAEAAKKTAIVFAPNMSVGVNVTLKLLELAAKSFSHGYDIEIIEAHHRHKVDAPSGTALKMGEVIADALGRDLNKVGVFAREGVTGERDPSSIGFATIRGGDIVGDHTVLFAGIGERIEITHKSSSRVTYAHGSLRAAHFLQSKTTGLYDMHDVLALR
jgi:4-hydroxy-tetrahydrodipicolinate reductase